MPAGSATSFGSTAPAGYGALKAILDILAAEEPLTLTEISLRLRRTPGSTKDYLSWLEDVDLVASSHKKATVHRPAAAPVGAPALPAGAAAARGRGARGAGLRAGAAADRGAAPRSPPRPSRAVAPRPARRRHGGSPELAYAGVEASSGDDRKGWGIIEID